MTLCYYRHPDLPTKRNKYGNCKHCMRWHNKRRNRKPKP